jgi:hypothetical protein
MITDIWQSVTTLHFVFNIDRKSLCISHASSLVGRADHDLKSNRRLLPVTILEKANPQDRELPNCGEQFGVR